MSVNVGISFLQLQCLLIQVSALTPQQRGELLEKTDVFAAIHLDAAQDGQTAAPAAEDNVEFHFTAFVPAPDPLNKGSMRLIELDGVRGGPIDSGQCENFLEVSFFNI